MYLKKNFNDRGRTAMEIFAIIAIAAILTLVAFIGFSFAMDKQRANEVIEGGQRRALVIMEQVNLYNLTPTLKAFRDDETSGGTFGKEVIWVGDQFAFQVSGVKKRVCKNILNMLSSHIILSRLSLPETPEVPIEKCEETMGTYLLVYDNDMKAANLLDNNSNNDNNNNNNNNNDDNNNNNDDNNNEEDEEECEQEKVTIYHCNGTTTKCCPDNGNQCNQPERCCNTVSECTGQKKQCIDNECRCPDGYFQNKNGNCTECSLYSNKEPVSEKSCLNCKNFGYERKMVKINGKMMCVFDGDCPEGEVKAYRRNSASNSTDMLCLSCYDSEDLELLNAADCEKCPNRERFGNVCTNGCESGSFRGSDRKCYQCSELNKIKPNKEGECDLCSNREMLGDYCVLKECPSGYFQRNDGTCISCDASGSPSARTEAECLAKCPDRIFNPLDLDGQVNVCGKCSSGYYYQTDYMTCRSCNSSADNHPSTEKACAACDDTPWPRHLTSSGRCIVVKCPSGYFKTTGGGCTECSDPYTRDLYEGDAEHCKECDGTAWPRQMINGHCGPALCKAGQFLKSDGNCAGCDSQSGLTPSSAEECAKCSTSSNPRQMVDGICMLVNCPTGKFLNSNGNCTDCSHGSGIISLGGADECAKCNTTDNPRKMIYNKCVPENASCSAGQFINAGHWWGFNCADCSSGGAIATSAEECAKCNDSGTPRRMLSDGTCVKACSSDKFMTTSGGCVLCSNNSINDAESPEDCLACNNSGSNRKLIDGKCVKDCGAGQFLNSSGACVSCTNTNSTTSYNEAECLSCNVGSTTLREYNNGYCNAACGTDTFRATNGSCYTCTETNPQAATSEECGRCSNRRLVDGMCVRKCASGKFLASDGTSCQSCSDVMKYEPFDESECTGSCPARKMMTYQGVNYCVWECPEGYFRNANLNCTACSDKNAKETSTDQCNLCPNRKMVGNKCTKVCEPGETILSDGSCRRFCTSGFYATDDKACKACNDVMKYKTYDEAECKKCSDRLMVTYGGATYCAWDCPSGYFRNENKNCTGCADSKASSKLTYRSECAKCTSHRTFNPNNPNDTSDSALGYCTYQ